MKRITLLIFAVTICAVNSSMVVSGVPPDFAGFYPGVLLEYPRSFAKVGDSMNGTIVGFGNPNMTGNIVLVPHLTTRFYVDATIYTVMQVLPKAIVLIPPFPQESGWDEFFVQCISCAEDWVIPVLGVTFIPDKLFPLFGYLQNHTAYAEIVFEKNPWREISDSGIYWFVGFFNIGLAGTGLILSIVKWIQFARNGFKLSIAQINLTILIIMNVFLILQNIDDWYARQVLPEGFKNCFKTYFWPMVITVCFMFALYWHELVSLVRLQVRMYLSKGAIPMICVASFVLVWEFISSSMALTIGVPIPAIYFQTYYSLAIIAGIAFFFAIMGIRVIVFLRQKNMNKKRVKTTTAVVLVISALLLLWTAMLAAFPAPGIQFMAYGERYGKWVMAFCACSIGMIMPLSYHPTYKKYKSAYSTASMSSKGA